MALLKQFYTSITSPFFSHTKNAPSSDTRSTKNKAQEKKQLAAQKQIRLSPSSIGGYLASAHVYKQQNNFREALSVYERAVQFVKPDDAQYLRLKEEMEEMSRELTSHDKGFHQHLSYDVLCLIFEYLDTKDLLRCAGVCYAWCAFMMDWPEFWRKISIDLPQISRSTLYPLLQGKVQEFRLTGPISKSLQHDVLMFLAFMKSNSIHKLHFCNLDFSQEDLNLLVETLRIISPPVRSVTFLDCQFPKLVIQSMLEVCSSMEHVSFSRSKFIGSCLFYSNVIRRPTRRTIVVPKDQFISLTYLQICIDERYDHLFPQVNSNYLSGILRQSPNLVHLFLSSVVPIHHGHCMRQAMKHCQRLQNFVLNNQAKMPGNTYLQLNNDNEDTTSTSRPPQAGLRRFVFMVDPSTYKSADFISVVKRHRKSLELLYMRQFRSPTLLKLARLTMPCLRELYIGMDGTASRSGRDIPIDVALAAMFSRFVGLKAITVYNQRSTVFADSIDYLYVGDQALRAIADKCHQLEYLKIIGYRQHTNDGILYFAKVGGAKLTQLEIDVDRTIVVDIIKSLESLQHFRLCDISGNPCNATPLTEDDRVAAQQILRSRGGTFVNVSNY